MLQVTSTSDDPLLTSSTVPVTAAGALRNPSAAVRALAPRGVTCPVATTAALGGPSCFTTVGEICDSELMT